MFKNKDKVTRRKEWSSYRSIYLSIKREIIAAERHKFAISKGYYNKCIGVKDAGNMLGYSTFKSKYPNASSSFNKFRSCFSCIACYSDKDMRFPGEDDIYKYVNGLDKVSDSVEVEEMEDMLTTN
ncbi:MAG: hypothetical protein U5L09_15115 [Bacteroidales bacterium]|nr:hypothetical protein [Bacteroidales bacterium]